MFCRKCLMPHWKTESWVLNPPQGPLCSFTGWWGWSTSSISPLSFFYSERWAFLYQFNHAGDFWGDVLECCPCISQVLRPGVLWFLRNLNDPDFNPVQEMIHLPIYRHLRRFILSVVSKCSPLLETLFKGSPLNLNSKKLDGRKNYSMLLHSLE